jgi:hypothetical protein
MAVVAIAINLMVFLGDCARFDRLTAETVRVNASTSGHSDYGLGYTRDMIQHDLEESFAEQSAYLRPSVEGYAVTLDGSTQSWEEGVTFVFIPHHEIYVCTLEYRPWGFGDSFFGVEFSGITHTRSFTIDPFRPGVLL